MEKTPEQNKTNPTELTKHHPQRRQNVRTGKTARRIVRKEDGKGRHPKPRSKT